MSAPDPLVVAEGLVRHYPLGGGEVVRAVDDVSLTIRRGETFGLVGESGSGKSSVARALLRLEPLTAGTVHFDGIDVGALGRRELRRARRRMQMVFQDPHGSLNRRETVAQLVAAPLLAHGEPAPASRIDELLELVGLGAAYRDRYPHEMSGGQCQRVAIARALAFGPRFLMMDEPFGALDMMTRERMQTELLRIWASRPGTTIVFITHSISEAVLLSDRIVVMSARPGRVMRVIDVDIERPRTDEVRKDERFLEIEAEIRDLIFSQEHT